MGKLVGRFLRILAWIFPYYKIRSGILRQCGYKIGRNAYIGFMVLLDGQYPEYIEIRDEASIAPGVTIMAHSRGSPFHQRKKLYGKGPEKVIVGRGSWIAVGAIILPGVTIGEGSVIGANSVVTRDIPPFSIAAGAPSKVIRARE